MTSQDQAHEEAPPGAATQGVNLVTRMPTGWSRFYKYMTLRWILRYPLLYGAIRRFHGRSEVSGGPAPMLEAMNFLHFARWVVLNQRPVRGFNAQGLPHFPESGQPGETIRDGVMLFMSNFDHDWEPYVDTFMEVAEDELGAFWDNMKPEWRKPSEIGFERFFEFVNDHVVPSDHYYAAFPELATADIKSALFVDRHVRSFHLETKGLAEGEEDEAWGYALDLLVQRLQRSLGRINMKTMEGPNPAFGTGGGGQHVAVTSLAPLKLEHVRAVRAAIRTLGTGANSPFRRVDGTHFARLVLIDEIPSAKRAIPLESGYLLLSADADGTTASSSEWLGRLWDVGHSIMIPTGPFRSETLVNALWGECYGFGKNQSRAEFIDYMMATCFDPTVPFADYPAISLWDIHRSIKTHELFTEFVFSDDYATAGKEATAKARRAFCKSVEASLLPIDPEPTSSPVPDLTNVQANVLRGTSKWRHACYVFYRIDPNEADKARGFLRDVFGSGLMADANDNLEQRSSMVNVAFTAKGLAALDKNLRDGERYERTHITQGRRRPGFADRRWPGAGIDGSLLATPTEVDPSSGSIGAPAESTKLSPLRGEGQSAENSQDGSAFASGMKARAKRLGDRWPGESERPWWVDDEDDEHYGQGGEADWPHFMLWVSAESEEVCHGEGAVGLKAVLARLNAMEQRAAGGVKMVGRQTANVLPRPSESLDGSRQAEVGYEHFGFLDGVSQPAIEGFRTGWPGDGKIGARRWEPIKVGEFILGYPDEGYGKGWLPEDEAPLLRDGTFLVYRKLRQDVPAFRRAVEALTPDGEDEDEIAAKLMGRRQDGAPLMLARGLDEPPRDKLRRNDFTYRDDPEGDVCPFTSHVRRANPRTDLRFEGRRVNRHRIIRRGMPYGPRYEKGEEPETERGLIFIAFNARIEDQFEFIQQEWLNGGRVFRTGDDSDLVAGAPSPDGRRIVLKGDKPIARLLKEEVTVFRGGEYFFVPSFSALRILSGYEAASPDHESRCDEGVASAP